MIRHMTNKRKCIVSLRDEEGVEQHSAELVAESLYEAAALAIQQFRRSEWSRGASLEAGTLRVEVCEPSTFYRVKVRDVENWLARSAGKPREVAARQKVRAKLRT
jgi:hypothetical protein